MGYLNSGLKENYLNDFSNVNNLKILKILPKYIHNDELAEFCNEFFTALNKHVPVNKNTFDPIIRATWLTSSKRKLCFALALTLCPFIKRRANLISEIIILFVTLLHVLSKIYEWYMLDQMYIYFNQILSNYQCDSNKVTGLNTAFFWWWKNFKSSN